MSVGIVLSQNISNNLIGGTAPGAGNVIAASSIGIEFDNAPVSTVIQGNLIGTDATGTIGIGGGSGISSEGTGDGSGTVIGGVAPGAGNLISGNLTGINLGGSGLIILGNRIGTDITGTMPIGKK